MQTNGQKELCKLKNRIAELTNQIDVRRTEIGILEGERCGLRTAVEILEPFIIAEPK